MNYLKTIIFSLLIFINLHSNEIAPPPDLQLISSFEGGNLYRTGKINVLDLHGNYREMGRQYGSLLSKELNGLYRKAVQDYFIKEKNLSQETMQKTAESLFHFYPQRFKDIIIGMAETSGLSLNEQILLNALELYGSMSGCSCVIAGEGFTEDNSLIAGRNYDWFDSYSEFAHDLTVTVFHPESGISTAITTFAGVIYATTGINEQGIFLELNNGLPSGGTLKYANRIPAIINLLAFLFDYATLDQIDAAFNSTKPNFSFIINVANASTAYSYEWAPFELQRRIMSDGLLVSTNHFLDPAWGLILQDNAGFSSELRRDNLLILSHAKKGEINPETMMGIFDTPMTKLGATWPDEGSIRTVYQIVTVPGEMKIWVKVPGYQNWSEINLKALFNAKE